MNTYFRITAYLPKDDISVILDANGKYQEIWEFSAFLVSKGFKIIDVIEGCEPARFAEATFPLIEKPSSKIHLRATGKGRPEIEEFVHDGKNVRMITVYDKIYALYI